MISIGEYLADMDLQRKGAPLSMLLLRHPEWESCMPCGLLLCQTADAPNLSDLAGTAQRQGSLLEQVERIPNYEVQKDGFPVVSQ